MNTVTTDQPANSRTGTTVETVVLVHGFGANRMLMRPMERRLQRLGYATLNWGYPSLVGSLERHARRLREELEKVDEQAQVFHLVGHSMGAIIARLAQSYGALPNLRRTVLIAPPNRGTPVARWFGPLLRSFCPAVWELADHHESFVNSRLPDSSAATAVIQAQYDWMVPSNSVDLEGQDDHICLRATHGSVLFQREAALQIHRFLSTGRFLRGEQIAASR